MQHDKLMVSDLLSLVGELEHQRRHVTRAAKVVADEDLKFFYLVKAEQLKRVRRKVQEKLPMETRDWCIVKSGSAIKQLNNELLTEDLDLFSEIESIEDDLLGKVLGIDLSECESCATDRKVV